MLNIIPVYLEGFTFINGNPHIFGTGLRQILIEIEGPSLSNLLITLTTSTPSTRER
jgi:hypothetical protein